MLRDCSIVVGMHPDSATESLVDFALAHGKPFAVVPCCVCAVDFPKRRGVNSHAALVDHLRRKDPERIGVATLPFEGKNVVLYSLPRRTTAPSSQGGGEGGAAILTGEPCEVEMQLCEEISMDEEERRE